MNFDALNTFFDKIYVITLKRAKERHENISKALNGLHYEFFYGADKITFNINEIAKQGIYDKTLAIHHHRYHKPMNAGQVGCAWSHRQVYEKVIENNWKNVLILEDDVYPLDKISRYAETMLNELPPDWELLYLDYSKNDSPKKVKQIWYHIQKAFGGIKWSHDMIRNLHAQPYSKHLAYAGFHDFTNAYACTNSGARKLLNMQTPISFVADNLLATACSAQLINAYIAKPKLFRQDSQGQYKLSASYVDE